VGVLHREKSDSELVEDRRLIVPDINRLMGAGNAPTAATVSLFWSRLANAARAFLLHMRSTTAAIGMVKGEERIRKARAWEHPIIGCEVRKDPPGDVGAPVKGSYTSVESTPRSTLDRRSIEKI
jgi:hypothetical protein